MDQPKEDGNPSPETDPTLEDIRVPAADPRDEGREEKAIQQDRVHSDRPES